MSYRFFGLVHSHSAFDRDERRANVFPDDTTRNEVSLKLLSLLLLLLVVLNLATALLSMQFLFSLVYGM